MTTLYNKENKTIIEGSGSVLNIIEKTIGRALTNKELDSYTDTDYGKKINIDGVILRTYKVSKTMHGDV